MKGRFFILISSIILIMFGAFGVLSNGGTHTALSSLGRLDRAEYWMTERAGAKEWDETQNVVAQLKDDWGVSDPEAVYNALPENYTSNEIQLFGMLLPLLLIVSGFLGIMASLFRTRKLFSMAKSIGVKLAVFPTIFLAAAVFGQRAMIAPIFQYAGLSTYPNWDFIKAMQPIYGIFRTGEANLDSPVYMLTSRRQDFAQYLC